jgi:VanZ family protein
LDLDRVSWLKAVWLCGPVGAYCLILFILSDQPSLPATPGGDLVAHFAAYTLLGILSFRAIALSARWSRLKVFLCSALGSALYGLSDEFHQSFVSGRFATLEDFVADSLGGLFGAACALFLYKKTESGAWRSIFGR